MTGQWVVLATTTDMTVVFGTFDSYEEAYDWMGRRPFHNTITYRLSIIFPHKNPE